VERTWHAAGKLATGKCRFRLRRLLRWSYEGLEGYDGQVVDSGFLIGWGQGSSGGVGKRRVKGFAPRNGRVEGFSPCEGRVEGCAPRDGLLWECWNSRHGRAA
jgi:hypothetical protein